jgi:CheY-like chemotaxis protein
MPSEVCAAIGLQVLVVDDATPVRDLLVNYFVRQRMAVTAVGDGLAAIKTLERNPGRFHLVVTDLNLPGADGFAVLAEARRVNPRCAVVIVTGYATMDSAIQAVRVGAYDFLSKPFTLSEMDKLLARIAADLEWGGVGEIIPPDHAIVAAPATGVVDLLERIELLEARLEALGERLPDGQPTGR